MVTYCLASSLKMTGFQQPPLGVSYHKQKLNAASVAATWTDRTGYELTTTIPSKACCKLDNNIHRGKQNVGNDGARTWWALYCPKGLIPLNPILHIRGLVDLVIPTKMSRKLPRAFADGVAHGSHRPSLGWELRGNETIKRTQNKGNTW